MAGGHKQCISNPWCLTAVPALCARAGLLGAASAQQCYGGYGYGYGAGYGGYGYGRYGYGGQYGGAYGTEGTYGVSADLLL